MIKLQEPYEKRPIRFFEVWECEGWKMKIYSIAYGRPVAREKLVTAAKLVAAERLPEPTIRENRYGVGYIGVHDGRGASFVFVDWWANENELFHHVYTAPENDPFNLRYTTSDDSITACVWDLALMWLERQIWVNHVLLNPTENSIEEYLNTYVEGEY